VANVDILAFGAHHDDVELGAGGTLLKMKSKGLTTGIVTLTKGEMNSRATTETIAKEALEAQKILDVDAAESLDLGDCKIDESYENKLIISEIIRKYRPKIVLAPYYVDHHIDHVKTGILIRNSNVLCRLKKLNSNYSPHGPDLFLFYLLQPKNDVSPALIVDISKFYDNKLKLVNAYKSQFAKNAEEQGVIPVGIGDYQFHIESRARFYGSLINVKYGEAFMSEVPLKVNNLLNLV
jgi:bacillithiol biosynthesis deacetylase BshB1